MARSPAAGMARGLNGQFLEIEAAHNAGDAEAKNRNGGGGPEHRAPRLHTARVHQGVTNAPDEKDDDEHDVRRLAPRRVRRTR